MERRTAGWKARRRRYTGAAPSFPAYGEPVNKSNVVIAVLALALLGGCAEYKEYTYNEYPMSREQVYEGIRSILTAEGYEIVDSSENFVNGMPQTELKTDWNMSQSGGVYKGNDTRRKAFITITTLYTERKKEDFQPLSEEQGRKYREREKEEEENNKDVYKKTQLERTRLGIAVNSEHRDVIDRPLEADWIYDGPDGLTVAQLMGRFEAYFGAQKQGGGAKLSPKGERLAEERIRDSMKNR